jgi:hypothetical protein
LLAEKIIDTLGAEALAVAKTDTAIIGWRISPDHKLGDYEFHIYCLECNVHVVRYRVVCITFGRSDSSINHFRLIEDGIVLECKKECPHILSAIHVSPSTKAVLCP